MANSEDRILVIFVSDILRITFYEDHKGEDIIDQRMYTAIDNSRSTYFYDMLRNSEDEIIGIRLWTENEILSLISTLENDFVSSSVDQHYLAVFFGNEREFDYRYSNDQMFGISAVLKSPESKFILYFELTPFLEEKEIIDIKNSPYFV